MSHVSYNYETWHSYTLPKEDSENVTWYTPGVLLTSAFFSLETSNFCYIKKYRYRLHFNPSSFVWVFKGCFNKHGSNFYDVIISVHDVTSKIISINSNCIANVFMWPKFGSSNISMREVITSFLYGFDQKN